MRMGGVAIAAASMALLAGSATANAAAPQLRAGVGQADITPPKTGYYLGGWTRADRLALGQSSRLYAMALVLARGARKIALVDAELFSVPAGMQEEIAKDVADLGFDKTTVLLQGDHTHSGPGGFSNNPIYNTAAPSIETVSNPTTFVDFFNAPPADKQLYTFLERQIVQAIRRANADRGRAEAGWGHSELRDVTENRSIEAHLRNFGIDQPYGKGTPEMDPLGPDDTIDPNVDVLRVDKLVRRKGRTIRVPIGGWSTFADHGTVVHSELQAYSGDHQATAWRLFTKRVRAAGHVPPGQAVVDVYPNSDEGDQTAGIAHIGPAAANYVGRREADAMFSAWKQAAGHLSRTPVLDVRWTRTCFCGRGTATGPVASSGEEGLSFLTGSEEGRGPLFDITGMPFEGVTNPISDPVQGDKIPVPVPGPPPAVPISVTRIGTGAITAIPAEPTKEVGTRVRAAVLAALRPAGVDHVVIGGLANDYIQYITTPEEYASQSYEAASTLYGRNEATFIQERLVELAKAMADGAPAPAPYPLDESFGVSANGPAYARGAAAGSIAGQPKASYERLGHASFSWKGGPDGTDRPVDGALISAQRRVGSRWRTVDSDLGLSFLWRSDASGRYDSIWEIPLDQPTGTYRFVVTASRYTLTSRPFAVAPLTKLGVKPLSAGVIELTYPAPVVDVDLTDRPAVAAGGSVRFSVGGRTVTVRHRRGTRFVVPAGAAPVVAGAARDRYGNTN